MKRKQLRSYFEGGRNAAEVFTPSSPRKARRTARKETHWGDIENKTRTTHAALSPCNNNIYIQIAAPAEKGGGGAEH